jgi:glycosyltransferase involved in cell wall biosynthesis
LKVLHLVASLGAGGAERQLYLLCRESSPRVDNHLIAIKSEGRWAAPIRSLGVPVECLRTPLRDPFAIFRLRKRIASIRPDVVHCWLPAVNLIGALASWPVPVVASVHNVDDWKPWHYRMADRLLSPLWNAVLSNSRAGARQTLRAGIPPAKVCTIPNGLEFRPPLARTRNRDLTICIASRLVRQKRVDLALRIAGQLPEARFLIAGDGPLREQLASHAPRNTRFLGQLADLAPLFGASDIFLSTSDREGMSNSLMEAMQAGCVPVVSPAGDNALIVEDRISGRVVEPSRMSGAILETTQQLDEMSANAARAVQKFTVQSMVEQTVALYRRVLAREVPHANPLPGLHQ